MRMERNFGSITSQSNKSNDAKKAAAVKRKQNIMMFLSVFLVLLIIFLGFAKMLSPDVDITLGDDSANYQEEENMNEVDSRLKELQDEDDAEFSDEAGLIEEDGLVKIPIKEKSVQEEAPQDGNLLNELKAEIEQESRKETITPAAEQTVQPAPVLPASVSKTYRVYVGMYSSQAQAEVARGILQDAGLGVTPNIKQISGGYTLQVGAFSSKDAANNLSNKLLMNNYPSRVVSD